MASISITPKSRLTDLKNWFSNEFPNLKIEIFKQNHNKGEGNTLDEIVDGDDTLENLGYNKENQELIIFDDYSTNLVEHIFSTKLKLNVQIFRKNGHQWIQTTATDNWTLKEQIERAQFHLDETQR